MADKVEDLMIQMLSILANIKCKTIYTPSDTNNVYMYVLHVYFITFAGQFLFTRWNYIVNTGPENICYFNDRTFSM